MLPSIFLSPVSLQSPSSLKRQNRRKKLDAPGHTIDVTGATSIGLVSARKADVDKDDYIGAFFHGTTDKGRLSDDFEASFNHPDEPNSDIHHKLQVDAQDTFRPLSPAAIFALSEIFDRYTISNRGCAMILKMSTRNFDDLNSLDNSLLTHDKFDNELRRKGGGSDFLLSDFFYLDVSGSYRAQAWTFVRSLYSSLDEKVDSLDKNTFLNHYRSLYQHGDSASVQNALELHGYSDGLSACVLNMTNRSLGVRAVAHICECLAPPGCCIKILDVSNNELRDISAVTLCEALASNSSLDRLILSSNPLPARAIWSLAISLMNSVTRLRVLELCDVGIGRLRENVMTAMADIIIYAPCLRVLDLSGNALRNRHAQAIAAALVASAESLELSGGLNLLRLSRNKIGHYGISAIGNAFAHPESSLSSLDVSGNPLGSVGGEYLAAPLKKSTRLRTLIANSCQLGYRLSTDDGDIRSGQATVSQPTIDGRGLVAIFQAMRYNNTLVALSIRDNWCGGKGHTLEIGDHNFSKSSTSVSLQSRLASTIARQIGRTTLTHLDIGLLGLGAEGILQIAKALIKGSGVDELRRLREKHKAAVQDFSKRQQEYESSLAYRKDKLAKIKAFVCDRREKSVQKMLAEREKMYAMVADLKQKASRKTISNDILKDRMAKAEAKKVAYSIRSLKSEQLHNLNLSKLDQRLVAPTFDVHQIERRLRKLDSERQSEYRQFKADTAAASMLPIHCHLTSLDVSWNINKDKESNPVISAAAESLGRCLSVVPTLTSLRASGNNFPLEAGIPGAGTIGEGIGLGNSVLGVALSRGIQTAYGERQRPCPPYRGLDSSLIAEAHVSSESATVMKESSMLTDRPMTMPNLENTIKDRVDNLMLVRMNSHMLDRSVPLQRMDLSHSSLHCSDAVALASALRKSFHISSLVELDVSSNNIWQTAHSRTLGHANGYVCLLQVIRHAPKLKHLILKDNPVDSESDARRIRSAIVGEIGAVPHALTKAIWRVPVTSIQKLDVTGCKVFRGHSKKFENIDNHDLSCANVKSHIERAQEMMFFFKCLSKAFGKEMNGANTIMPLHWEGLSPADVAMQILVKHGFPSESWSSKRAVAIRLMREWEEAPNVLIF